MPNVTAWRGAKMMARGLRNLVQEKPVSVSFEITHACTANCWHCNLGGRIREERLSPSGYAEICRRLRPVVCHVSGGEPLVRGDVYEIIEALRSVRSLTWLVVVSNGSLLTPDRFLRLKKAGMLQLSLSLDFPDERHDEFRRIPGLFHRLNQVVPELASGNERDDILLNVCMTRWNFRDIPDIVRLAKAWGVGVNFSAFSHLRTGDRSGLIPPESREEFRQTIQEILRLRDQGYPVYNSPRLLWEYFRFLTGEPIPGCAAGRRFLVVNPDGRMTPCANVLAYFDSQEEMYETFTRQNTCQECYIATRSLTEMTVWQLVQDNLAVFNPFKSRPEASGPKGA